MKYKSELQLQAIIWQWFYNSFPEFRLPKVGNNPRCLLIHNLLNAKSHIEAAKLSGAGLTKGFPDLTLFVPSKGFHGLHIELKLQGQKPRKEQIEVLEALKAQNYQTCVCDNHEDAQKIIKEYLAL